MQFDKGYIYHIYNQGNNKQKIFFHRENYLFFLKKIKTYITPYADILAWTLMPNHFHLMVLVNELTIGVAQSETKDLQESGNPTPSRVTTQTTLNRSLGIMLASYSRAINIQNGTSGSLFRKHTKAECVNCPKGITPSFYNTESGTQIHISDPQKQYPQVCFNYIHNNPVKAGLVKTPGDWEYSSFKDYHGVRDGKLINRTVASKYVEW
jgi:putative transposase